MSYGREIAARRVRVFDASLGIALEVGGRPDVVLLGLAPQDPVLREACLANLRDAVAQACDAAVAMANRHPGYSFPDRGVIVTGASGNGR